MSNLVWADDLWSVRPVQRVFNFGKLFNALPPPLTRLLHAFGILFPLAFGIYHLTSETTSIGLFSFAAGIFAIGSYISFERGKDSSPFFLCYIAAISFTLAIACYYHGYRGLVYTYPFTISLFYFLRFQSALISALVFSIICLYSATHTTDLIFVVRHGAALAITISFAACYAYVINMQKAQLEREAYYDPLTGIVNRKEFIRWLNSIIEKNRKATNNIALFYIDIDDFKQVNDNYGHATGDELLKAFSERIIATIRQDELIGSTNKIYNFARIAGDEFVLAIQNIDAIESAEKIAQRLTDIMLINYKLNTAELAIQISIGVVYSDKKIDAEKLLHNADIAMYRAKNSGKNTFYIYDDTISQEIARKKDIENSIADALKTNGFSLLYMPIYNIQKTPFIAGAEVLIRGKEYLPLLQNPEKFIPVAELSGQIRDIDQWVIAQAFQNIGNLDLKASINKLWFSINISACELVSHTFIDQLTERLQQFQIPAEKIHLEITETQLLPYDNRINDNLAKLKSLGHPLTLDDYGTGYTGFSQIVKFPGQYLKIDRSFIQTINDPNSPHQKMIDVMLDIAKIYQLQVIAEGVETANQLYYLQKRGCHFAQGYYFSKPLEWDQLNNITHSHS